MWLIIIIVLCIITGLYFSFKGHNVKLENTIFFGKYVKQINMPVIPLQINGETYNFLLDSGSSISHICSSAAEHVSGPLIDVEYDYIGSTGSRSSASKMVELPANYKGTELNLCLIVNNCLDLSFASVKEETDFDLHGILGMDFLTKHKCVIDLSKLELRYEA